MSRQTVPHAVNSRPPRLRSLAVLAAALLGVQAVQAVGLGRLQTLSSLGQPLHLLFPLTLGSGESLSPDCVIAEVLAGEARLPPGTVRIELEGGSQQSVRALRLRSTQQISEPIVTVNLQLGCPARLVRQYTAFIDPVDSDVPAAVVPAPQAELVRQFSPQLQAALATSDARPAELLAAQPPGSPEAMRLPAAEPSRTAGKVTPARSASAVEASRDGLESRDAAASPPAAVAPLRSAAKPGEAIKPAEKAPPKSPDRSAARSSDKSAERPAARKADEGLSPAAAPMPAATPRLRLEPAEALSDTASASGAAAAASAASAADMPASAVALPESEAERLVRLEQGLKLLQLEQREAEGQLVALRRQLEQARTERYLNPLVYGLAAAVLLLLGLLVLLWRSRQQERLRHASQWWGEAGEGAAPNARPAEAEVEAESQPPKPASELPPAQPRAVEPAAALPGLQVEYRQEHAAAVPTLELSQALSAELLAAAQPPHYEPTGPAPLDEASVESAPPPSPEPVLEPVSFQFIESAPAPAGARPALVRIKVEDLVDLEQQAEFFCVLGQDEAAIELLDRHIHDDARDVALPYLKLLRIYQRRDRRYEFETLAREFAEHFGRPIPAWDDALDRGLGLEGQPEVLRMVQRRWGDSAATMSLLQALLVGHAEHGSVPEVLPATAYDLGVQADLLLLYGVARDISEQEVRGADVDLFLPLDSAANPPASAMMATMVWQRPGTAPLAPPRPLEVDISLDEAEPPRAAP